MCGYLKRKLKSGYAAADKWYPTAAATPQDRLISALLANIALPGIEAALDVQYRASNGGVNLQTKRAVVDFTVFCETLADAEASRQIPDELMKD